jgi:23S rRNA (adenine2503-C2)-methyltransferase
MTVSAPITQDVLTLPRKLSEGPVNLIGLSRSALVQTLIDCGLAEKKSQDAQRSDLAVDLSKRRSVV